MLLPDDALDLALVKAAAILLSMSAVILYLAWLATKVTTVTSSKQRRGGAFWHLPSRTDSPLKLKK